MTWRILTQQSEREIDFTEIPGELQVVNKGVRRVLCDNTGESKHLRVEFTACLTSPKIK